MGDEYGRVNWLDIEYIQYIQYIFNISKIYIGYIQCISNISNILHSLEGEAVLTESVPSKGFP